MRFSIPLLTLSGILLLGSIPGNATPIKPDLKKLVDQAENARPYHYMPARVGWNGPENQATEPPPVIAKVQEKEAKQWLLRLAIPDPRMLVAFAVAIFGLRMIRRGRETRPSGLPA
jgi:hypothetical protein